jgi:hypothetical protein
MMSGSKTERSLLNIIASEADLGQSITLSAQWFELWLSPIMKFLLCKKPKAGAKNSLEFF